VGRRGCIFVFSNFVCKCTDTWEEEQVGIWADMQVGSSANACICPTWIFAHWSHTKYVVQRSRKCSAWCSKPSICASWKAVRVNLGLVKPVILKPWPSDTASFGAGAPPLKLNYCYTSTKLQAGRQGFDFREGQGFVLFTTASRPTVGPTQAPVRWVPWAFSLGVRLPVHEIGAWSYTSTPQYAFIPYCSIKHKSNFALIFSLWNLLSLPPLLMNAIQ
jgi:hypothetical protein